MGKFKAPKARSRPLRGVQDAFGAFKAPEARSRLWSGGQGSRRRGRVQGCGAAFRVAERRSGFKAPGARSGFKVTVKRIFW